MNLISNSPDTDYFDFNFLLPFHGYNVVDTDHLSMNKQRCVFFFIINIMCNITSM